MLRKGLFVMLLALSLAGVAQAQVQVQESTVRVHISGRVQRPGVYTLPRGSRGVDAIQAAGGIAKGAVLSDLNLASVLEDGERLVVPSKETQARSSGATVSTASPRPGRSSRPSARPTKRVLSLNQASLEDLDSLPGIGRSLAEEILRYRREKGRFRSLDELKEVPGIGARRFERLAPLLTL